MLDSSALLSDNQHKFADMRHAGPHVICASALRHRRGSAQPSYFMRFSAASRRGSAQPSYFLLKLLHFFSSGRMRELTADCTKQQHGYVLFMF